MICGMALYEFRAEIPGGDAARADECLLENEAAAWSVIEDVDARRAWVAGVFADRALGEEAWAWIGAALASAGIGAGRPVVRALPDADWRDSYKAHFKAWRFGPLHWVPVWERDRFVPAAGDRVLWLDPGMAFGTGNHETTRLCCERLVEFARRRGVPGSVLDAGCGSGILALSAARLGLAPVVGFDNDPLAVEISRENAQLNDLASAVEFFVGDLQTGLARRRADLVLANIQADVLVRFAGELLGAVAPGGELVLSGILASELAPVRAVFTSAARGWTMDTRILGEWSDLVLMTPES